MKKKIFFFSLSLFSAVAVVAQTSQPLYLDESQPIEVRVQDALSRMTLEEKVKLCTAQSKFSSHGVPRLGIPELWMSDGPHGVREEILWDSWGVAGFTNDSCTAFPALTCLAATWNPEMSALYGKSIGEEARIVVKTCCWPPVAIFIARRSTAVISSIWEKIPIWLRSWLFPMCRNCRKMGLLLV